MELFKIMLGNKKAEFSVIGIANHVTNTAVFQALMNGVPFAESDDFEEMRETVIYAVELNQPEKNENLS